MLEWLDSLDTQLFYTLNHARLPFLDEGFRFLYTFPNLTLLFSVSLAAMISSYLFRKKQASLKSVLGVLILISCTVGIADASSCIFKGTYERQRPLNSKPLVYFLDDTAWAQTPANFVPKNSRSFSFYSGHATNAMTLAVTVSAFVPPVAPLAYAMALGVGYSRIYVGKHYPLDVAAGWIMGFLYGSFAVYCYRRMTYFQQRTRFIPRPAPAAP